MLEWEFTEGEAMISKAAINRVLAANGGTLKRTKQECVYAIQKHIDEPLKVCVVLWCLGFEADETVDIYEQLKSFNSEGG